LSQNIQNSFISIDKNAIEPYALIASNQSLTRGIKLNAQENTEYTYNFVKNDWQYNSYVDKDITDEVEDVNVEPIAITENTCMFNKSFKLVGYDPANALMAHIKTISYAVWDSENKKEDIITIKNDSKHGFYIEPHNISTEGKETLSKTKVSVVGWGEEKSPVLSEYIVEKAKNNVCKMEPHKYYLDLIQDSDSEDELDNDLFTNFKAK
jgi:hypothetical protein